MTGAIKPYLLPLKAARRLCPANDSSGVWVGMLPFSRLPFFSALVGLSLLSPLVLLDSGFSLYWANRQDVTEAPEMRQMQVSVGGARLAVPPALQRAARVKNGVATFQLERIGRHLMPASASGEATALDQTLRISSAKSRPPARTILHSLSALQAPVLVETSAYGFEVYRLASGPVTKADELVIGLQEDGELAAGDAPFFAVCSEGENGFQRACTAYLEAGSLFVEVDFAAEVLDEWRLIRSSAIAFAATLQQKGADAAP